MKRHIAAGLSILALSAGVGWELASHPETSAKLQEVQLDSEHSQPGSTKVLAGIRIRLSGSALDDAIKATDQNVPQISLVTE